MRPTRNFTRSRTRASVVRGSVWAKARTSPTSTTAEAYAGPPTSTVLPLNRLGRRSDALRGSPVVSNDDVVTERMQQEARVAGLRDFRTPSLEAVEKRRLQLWILTAVLLVSISLGIVFVSTWQTNATRAFASTPVLRIAVVLLSMAFAVYAIEKERHLRKLSRLLVDERVLTTALSNRLREVELLLGAGKAMNDVLELSVVLQTILHSAVELLGSESGSVMLVEGDHDLGVAVSTGNERATGGKVRLGEGIAGHVASTREALL